MKVYLVSLAVGVLAGLLYALLNVRSPAPPAVALIGLLGMLIGEQVLPIAKRVVSGEPVTVSWFMRECAPSITGQPPPAAPATAPAAASANEHDTT